MPSGGRINKTTKLPQNNNETKETKSNQNADVVDGNEEQANRIDSAHLMEGVSESSNSKNENDTPKRDENKRIAALNRSEESSIGSTTSLNNAINSDPNPSGGSSSQLNQDDTKSSSTTSSAQYSITDNSETNEPKRTLLNKYVKKVKNLMKK